MEKIFKEIQENIFYGKTQETMDATKLALREGYSIEAIVNKSFYPAFKELGIKMHDGDIFITDVLMASRAMRSALYVLKPFLADYTGKSKGVVVIGTVAGDLHDIGKDLVAMALTGSGYTVINLGIDITKETFADAVKNYRPHILAISALLTTTMPEMINIIDYLEKSGLRSLVKIIVGGGPVTRDFAEKIKADAYSADMYEAIYAVEDLMNNRIGSYSLKW